MLCQRKKVPQNTQLREEGRKSQILKIIRCGNLRDTDTHNSAHNKTIEKKRINSLYLIRLQNVTFYIHLYRQFELLLNLYTFINLINEHYYVLYHLVKTKFNINFYLKSFRLTLHVKILFKEINRTCNNDYLLNLYNFTLRKDSCSHICYLCKHNSRSLLVTL